MANNRTGPKYAQMHETCVPNDEESDGIADEAGDEAWMDEGKVIRWKTGFLQKYKVLKELGKGRFSVTKRVWCAITDEEFAAKFVYRTRQTRDATEREYRLQRYVAHPAFTTAFALFAQATPKFDVIVSQLVPGLQIIEWLFSCEAPREVDLSRLLLHLLSGLEYLHSRYIVHLDLKPENLLVDISHRGIDTERSRPRLRLVDLGSALLLPRHQARAVDTDSEDLQDLISNDQTIDIRENSYGTNHINNCQNQNTNNYFHSLENTAISPNTQNPISFDRNGLKMTKSSDKYNLAHSSTQEADLTKDERRRKRPHSKGPPVIADPVLGSVEFVAPEVITRRPLSLAADVWSFGVLIYALVSGELPFSGWCGEEIAGKVVRGEVEYPPEVFDCVSEEATGLLSALLVLRPSQRPSMPGLYMHPWFSMERHGRTGSWLPLQRLAALSKRRSYNLTSTQPLTWPPPHRRPRPITHSKSLTDAPSVMLGEESSSRPWGTLPATSPKTSTVLGLQGNQIGAKSSILHPQSGTGSRKFSPNPHGVTQPHMVLRESVL